MRTAIATLKHLGPLLRGLSARGGVRRFIFCLDDRHDKDNSGEPPKTQFAQNQKNPGAGAAFRDPSVQVLSIYRAVPNLAGTKWTAVTDKVMTAILADRGHLAES
jgi:hypothetical protein